ncbi:MAG: copper amine oxidase N-terminal domain-containing protein [Candidatus Baltobacteraceae bacterium]
MPRALLAALVFMTLSAVMPSAHAQAQDQAQPTAPPAPAFGNPPSGEYPILFNDHTVYATPDVLKQSRVLAALVRGGVIYVPLRSMFEQMGATVSVSADGNSISAVKPGASVSVTVGKKEVVINGETRPLDVPPMVYKGVVLVPVRVISEAMGAYVLWVSDRRLVVVRYNPATPAPAVTQAPTSAPSSSPTPSTAPTERPYTAFVQGAASHAKNYNEFSAGLYCESFLVNGALVFANSPLALKIDYRIDSYVTSATSADAFGNHYTNFATIDGGVAQTPVFLGRQSSLDARLEFQVAAPRYNIGIGYLHATNNYGYPSLNGIGGGVEKLPSLRPGISWYGSAFDYPSVTGTYTVSEPASTNYRKSYRQQYAILKYDVGLALSLRHFPLYLYGGLSGDRYTAKANAPLGQTHDGPYIGLGLKF